MKQRELVQLLFRKASQDQAVLEKLLPDPEFDDETIGFHAQEALSGIVRKVRCARSSRHRCAKVEAEPPNWQLSKVSPETVSPETGVLTLSRTPAVLLVVLLVRLHQIRVALQDEQVLGVRLLCRLGEVGRAGGRVLSVVNGEGPCARACLRLP